MKSGERGYLVTALVTATLLGAIAGCGGHVEGEGVGSAPSADTGQRPTVTELGGCAYAVVITSDARDVELGALVGSPQCPAQVRLTIAAGVRVGASSPKRAALTIGGLARGSSVTIENNGKIVGAGGAGGDGGNGGSGGDPVSCGRPGAPGGTALQVELPTTLVTVGEILGGGGGGGGASGGNLAIGGGGGAGGGAGGRPATTLSERDELAYCGQDNGYREGTAGAPGTIDHPGLARRDEQHRCRGGQGGEPGMPGEPSDCYGAAEGGAGGSAIAIGRDATVNVPNGPYDTGAGAIRGAVGPR